MCRLEEEAIIPPSTITNIADAHIAGKTLYQIFKHGGENTMSYKTVSFVIAISGNNRGEDKCFHEQSPKTKTSHT